MKKLILRGFVDALLTGLYIAVVAWLVFNGQAIFGGKPIGMLAPVMFLLSFIISALITGMLVLGKPILMYLAGEKREGITLLIATLAWLIVLLAAVALTIAI